MTEEARPAPEGADRRRRRSRSGWGPILAVCLTVSVLAVVAADRLLARLQHRPEGAKFNVAHLTQSMASHYVLRHPSRPFNAAEQFNARLPAGSQAPDFTLSAVPRGTVSLSAFRGQQVVIVFGSFSCSRLCEQAESLEQLYRAYRDRVAFLFVSITEAGHAIPGIDQLPPNSSAEERGAHTAKVMKGLGLSMPIAVDEDCRAEYAYDAYPARIVVVDAEGRIGTDAGRILSGDWDWHEIGDWLDRHNSANRRPDPNPVPDATR